MNVIKSNYKHRLDFIFHQKGIQNCIYSLSFVQDLFYVISGSNFVNLFLTFINIFLQTYVSHV